MTGSSAVPPDPRIPMPEGAATPPNDYASLQGQMNLTEATFEAAKIDQQKLEEAIAQIDSITSSNLDAKAKWNSTLMTIDALLKTAGMVTRIVAVA